MKAILSCRFSGGTINLSSFSVATNKVSIFVVFAIEGCKYNTKKKNYNIALYKTFSYKLTLDVKREFVVTSLDDVHVIGVVVVVVVVIL